ncbi:MAG: chemotaxis-specific protein-glutamate methyltransferase CheB [Bosea sp.]|jgi:two-component system chemotaxis response regulator CheB|nr:chemotaxis-specific protein-glutamate methyltransferase CheB [Bosea sp. (in: a-proteobacteria)]
MIPSSPFKILVCDDQTTVRRLLMLLLGSIPGTQIIADVEDAETAWSVLVREPVDLVLLDLELPGRHGFALLERIMRECPVPVLIISGAAGTDGRLRDQALALGAVGLIQKPDGITSTHETLQRELAGHVALVKAGRDRQAELPSAPTPRTPAAGAPSGPAAGRSAGPLVAIGSSTGGIIAVIEVLKRLPPGTAPILITQHMLPGYAEAFASRLCNTTPHQVHVARGGEVLGPDTVLVAPSGRHLCVRWEGGRLLAGLDDQDKVSGHRPSCDVLFHAVTSAVGSAAIGVILTGMGRDGADGLLAMRRAGASTFAQDEASCVVFGMPRAALECGAVDRSTPLAAIGSEIAQILPGPQAGSRPPRRDARHTLQTEILP